MKNILMALVILIVLWPLFFMSILLYGRDFDGAKRLIQFNFKEFKKGTLLFSAICSFIFALIISFSVL